MASPSPLPSDAALPDAALPDAALPDAALPDAALPDAALPDAALSDAARPAPPSMIVVGFCQIAHVIHHDHGGWRRGSDQRAAWARERGDEMAEPVTLAVLGVGARGSMFSGFAERFRDRAQVVAVADPRADRREALAGRLGIAAGRRFGDWRDLAAQ